MIHLMQPSLGEKEIDEIADVFKSNWLGAGPRVKAFEKAFADYIEAAPHEFIATTCCTEGLFQVVSSLDLSPADEIVMPTISFIGAAHAVGSAKIRLQLADVDSLTLNPTLKNIEQAITPKTRAIVLLHYGGKPGSVKEIAKLARDRGIILVEDAACGLGSTHEGIACGNFGDVGVWSFDAMKLLVTGDGGMIRASDPDLREKLILGIKLGGIHAGFGTANSKSSRWWEVHPKTHGRRAIMNDLTAAIGLVQLKHIDKFLQCRHKVANCYNEAFKDIPWIRLPPASSENTTDYFYWIHVPANFRNKLAKHLLDNGVYTSFRYWPLHRTQLYSNSKSFPGADKAAACTLLLPMHQSLTNENVDKVIATVRGYWP